jgi:hypothetical protein
MKKVILIKQYPYFPYCPPGTELSFIIDYQADILVNKGIAKLIVENTKEVKRPPKNKMVRAEKTHKK